MESAIFVTQVGNGGIYKARQSAAAAAARDKVAGGSATSLDSVNWASPDIGGDASELETVNVNKVWQDFQRNGLTDTSKARVETQKRLIRESQESGKAFRAPDLSFVSQSVAKSTGLNPGFDVIDGRHRLTAFRELGFTKIKARVES